MQVYINMRDLLTWPKAMADTLASQGHDPIFVDNDSSYEPLLEYYKNTPYKVHRLDRNYGHLAPWEAGVIGLDKYVVTDPDLDISSIPSDWPEALQEGLDKFPDTKCGFSLSELNVPKANPAWFYDEFFRFPDESHPIRWGPTHKQEGIKSPFHCVAVDTTFALYRPATEHCIDGSRTGRPYTAIHLPWHIVETVNPETKALQISLDDELFYYYTHANQSSTTAGRLQAMLARYARQKGYAWTAQSE